MKLRIVSGKTMRVLQLEDVSQVVISTEDGDPCCAAIETADHAVIAGHAGEKDFQQLLRKNGMASKNRVEVLS